MVLFQLGRQPEIGLAEIAAVYDARPQPIGRRFALLDIDKDAALARAWRLGSVVKIMTVQDANFSLSRADVVALVQKLFAQIQGKVTIGLSFYGFKDASKTARQIGDIAKETLSGVPDISSVRLLTDRSGTLSTATALHNGLARGNNKKVELNFIKDRAQIIVATTLFVQNIDSYTVRDREKPRRDARNGMLPPKLAQTIINLAVGASRLPSGEPLRLYDPFCGTGTVLIEAALMRGDDRTSPLFSGLIGSDLNPQMIDNTRTNLAWADERLHAEASERATLFAADATGGQNPPDEQSSSVLPRGRASANAIATECYLGRPYTTPPASSELEQNVKTCDIIIGKFLKNTATKLPTGAGLCVAVPCWQVRGKVYHLPCLKSIERDGYQEIKHGANLVYRRPEQIVGRELVVLRKS